MPTKDLSQKKRRTRRSLSDDASTTKKVTKTAKKATTKTRSSRTAASSKKSTKRTTTPRRKTRRRIARPVAEDHIIAPPQDEIVQEEQDIVEESQEDVQEDATEVPSFHTKKLKKTSVSSKDCVSLRERRAAMNSSDDEEKPVRSSAKRSSAGRTIDDDLGDIYGTTDGSLPDMTQFERTGRGRWIRTLFFLLCSLGVFGAAVWYGLYVFEPGTKFSKDNVILSVSTDETVSYGQAVQYRIRYRNNQTTPLHQSSIEVRYPEGFVYSSSTRDPIDPEHPTAWELDTLDAYESGYIDVFGTLYGGVGEDVSVRAFLNYFPESFSSTFQEVAAVQIHLEDAPVMLRQEAPEEVLAGAPVTLRYVIEPSEQHEPATYRLMLNPGGFRVTESTLPSLVYEDTSWEIEVADEPVVLDVTGSFLSEEAVMTSLRSVQDGEARYEIAQQTYQPAITQADLEARIAINGSTDELILAPGDVMNTTITVANTGEESLTDVAVVIMFDAPSHDEKSLLYWGEIEDEADGAIYGEQLSDTMRRGQITWTAEEVPELADIAPGDRVSIDLRLPIKSDEQINLAQFERFDAQVLADVTYSVEDTRQSFSAAPIVITFVSDLSVDVRDEIEETEEGEMHTITWVLNNTFHELDEVLMKADLYGPVRVDLEQAEVPAGDLTYDEETKELRWYISALPLDIDVVAISIPVLLTDKNPTQENLTSRLTVTARDAVAEQEILRIGDEILLQTETEEE
jgi:hypothetical protein